MIDLLLELLIYFFGFKTLKNLKKRLKDRKHTKSGLPGQKRTGIDPSMTATIIRCTGCSRSIKAFPVYVQDKPWCPECYKSTVLKVREN